jgi:hypothetical protein
MTRLPNPLTIISKAWFLNSNIMWTGWIVKMDLTSLATWSVPSQKIWWVDIGWSYTKVKVFKSVAGNTSLMSQNSITTGNLVTGYPQDTGLIASNCVLDWQLVSNWSTITWYQNLTVPFWQTCASVKQIRTCSNWTLGGSATYQYKSCSVLPAWSCATNSTYLYSTWHTFTVPALNHGITTGVNLDLNENNWLFRYTLTLTCSNWAYTNQSQTGPTLQSCTGW